jgi:hypothetical protein
MPCMRVSIVLCMHVYVYVYAHVPTHTHAMTNPILCVQLGDDRRLIAVFGRDAVGLPLKRTILCQDPGACQHLAAVIHGILGLSI